MNESLCEPVSYTHLDVYKRQGLDPALDVAVWPDPRSLDADVAVCWLSLIHI